MKTRSMRMNFKIVCGICCLSSILFAASCADGIDDNEKFSGGVTNAQLESPKIDNSSFSVLVNPDGSESVKVTWPVVYGAGGYLYNVTIVDDPSNPIFVVKDSIVDGCSATFTKVEDTKYEVSIKTLGNDKLNNRDAETATRYAYSTLVPATVIPEGEEIAAYIKNNMVASDKEQGFELQGGKTYYLNDVADFGLNKVTFRGDKSNRATVVVGEKGGLTTQGGLKVKFINFDCTAMTQTGFLTLSATPDKSLSTESLGYKADGANQNGYVINDPVIFQECNFKNIKNSFLYGNKQNWSLRDFRITDCIIQLDNSGSNSFIHLQGGQNGLIKDMTLKNNTFYNLQVNKSAYFIRYSNASNAQPKKIFGNSGNSSTHVVTNNTFCRTMTNKDFANAMANTNTITATVEYNIFYDVFRLYQYIPTQGKKSTRGNIIWGEEGGTPNNNDTGSRKDDYGNPYATLENPQFVGPFLKELDLTKADGGVNFKPESELANKNHCGDPRWY